MKVTIHYNGDYEDDIQFEAENIEEAKMVAFEECQKRGWKTKHCWSEIEK